MPSQRDHRHDVVIVGARAAGAATALLLARLGYDVAVVDRVEFPADTVSTHQLARPGVVALQRWGLLDAVLASGAPAIRQVSFAAAGSVVVRQVKDRSGVDLLVAPRRYVLDTLVAEAAGRAGVHMRHGVVVTGVRRDGSGRVVGVQGYDRSGDPVAIDARMVVGADGLKSVVARSVGAAVVQDRGDHGAAQYAYFGGVAWPGIEMYVAERALAGVFPTHGGEACIWICNPSVDAQVARRQASSRTAAFTTMLAAAAPELVDRLRHADRSTAVTGMLHNPNVIRQAYGSGWALVGDAGYHRDPVTGHGLSDAYRDAELLATALDQAWRGEVDEPTALAGYQAQRDASLREVFELTCALAGYPGVPAFVQLQKQLSRALDVEAEELAARPIPGAAVLTRA